MLFSTLPQHTVGIVLASTFSRERSVLFRAFLSYCLLVPRRTVMDSVRSRPGGVHEHALSSFLSLSPALLLAPRYIFQLPGKQHQSCGPNRPGLVNDQRWQ